MGKKQKWPKQNFQIFLNGKFQCLVEAPSLHRSQWIKITLNVSRGLVSIRSLLLARESVDSQLHLPFLHHLTAVEHHRENSTPCSTTTHVWNVDMLESEGTSYQFVENGERMEIIHSVFTEILAENGWHKINGTDSSFFCYWVMALQ